jgi:predicted HicB family RNase H-like nuclease
MSLEDDCLIGRVLFIDDIITYEGATVGELMENFRAAVDHYLDYCKRTGKPANKPYSGTFNVRIGPQLHREAVIAANAASVNLNDFVTTAIKVTLKRASASSAQQASTQ